MTIRLGYRRVILAFLSLLISHYLIEGKPALQASSDTSATNTVNFATDVIYQIVTDRFFDGNPRNNPNKSLYDPTCTKLRMYCGGDWQGIIEKINDGYLTNMGVTAIWISPPVENIYSLLKLSL